MRNSRDKDGTVGKSAYEIWLDNGHTGTEIDFLEWLEDDSGHDESNGMSAYEIAVANGYMERPLNGLNCLWDERRYGHKHV